MILEKVKDDLYVPIDFSKNHFYFADAEGKHKYTGITTIIGVLAKPALIGWAARMAAEHVGLNIADCIKDGELDTEAFTRVLEEAKTAHSKKKEAAGAHGTDAHALVEQWILACLESFEGKPVNTIETDAISQFKAWACENVDHFLFAERRMANNELFIAGTADFAYIGKDGKKYMSDFKTSSGVYGIDYFLQVCAYRLLAEGEGDEPYDGMSIVRLGKDGAFEVQQLYDYETYKEAFLSCLTLYRAQAQIGGLVVK